MIETEIRQIKSLMRKASELKHKCACGECNRNMEKYYDGKIQGFIECLGILQGATFFVTQMSFDTKQQKPNECEW